VQRLLGLAARFAFSHLICCDELSQWPTSAQLLLRERRCQDPRLIHMATGPELRLLAGCSRWSKRKEDFGFREADATNA
jgi:hypothetical protein